MGKIADIIKNWIDIPDQEKTCLWWLDIEKEIIELITDIACYTINAIKIADEQFDTVSDFMDKLLENLAKLKED